MTGWTATGTEGARVGHRRFNKQKRVLALEAVREVHRLSTEMFGIVLMRFCYRDSH
jgi:hypothetical protein